MINRIISTKTHLIFDSSIYLQRFIQWHKISFSISWQWNKIVYHILMREESMGSVKCSFRTFFISDFVLQDMKKIFCQCYQNYLRHLWLKFFRWVEGIFRGTPKGGCPPPLPPINLEEYFSDLLATASSLNTLCGLETWYAQSR